MKQILLTLTLILIAFSSCKKDEAPNPNVDTFTPVIESLTSNKHQIMSGGSDPAILTCVAQGGNLEYLWEVDLGDIFPLNSEGSQVQFTGSECCVGEKILKCTVSNDKGSVMDTIIINIVAK